MSKIDAVILAGAPAGEELSPGRADLSRAMIPIGDKTMLQWVVDALKGSGPVGRIAAVGEVSAFDSFWVFNGFSVTATSAAILALSSRPEIAAITSDEVPILMTGAAAAAAEPNLDAIGAPALWKLGFTGQGVVVASMDTGVDGTHPDLAARWRGGSNSWYDPYGEHPIFPTDVYGHGTWVTGVMVGGSAGGSAVGIAPDAQWIAVKIFNDRGVATISGIHQGYQWLLDPDGNPSTADAPDLVNNSWALGNPGCNLEFQYDVAALKSAGIMQVFAGGNYGPTGSTSVSPANYPGVIAVGAVDNAGLIWYGSSRGPATCGGATVPYPSLVAPGVNVRTTDLLGGYYALTGTSMASPHVSGVLALLRGAFPGATAAHLRDALLHTAVDLGVTGPDNDYGYGEVDALAAYSWLAGSSIQPHVSLARVGSDLVLSWPAAPGAAGYEVWRSSVPYFVPGDAGATFVQILPTDLSGSFVYTDTGSVGGANPDWYYAVRTVGSTGAVSPVSNRVGKADFTLVETPGADYNWVSLPLSSTITTAAELEAALVAGSDRAVSVKSVQRWNPVGQNYQTFRSAPVVSGNFNVNVGGAYRVSVAVSGALTATWTLVGEVPDPPLGAAMLYQTTGTDYNWLMLPLDQTALATASLFKSDFENTSRPAATLQSVQEWNAVGQNFQTYAIVPLAFGDFALRIGHPYRVAVQIATADVSSWP